MAKNANSSKLLRTRQLDSDQLKERMGSDRQSQQAQRRNIIPIMNFIIFIVMLCWLSSFSANPTLRISTCEGRAINPHVRIATFGVKARNPHLRVLMFNATAINPDVRTLQCLSTSCFPDIRIWTILAHPNFQLWRLRT